MTMNQDVRLPHNAKEGLLYGGVICAITALLMATFNIYLQVGAFNATFFMTVLKAYPLFFTIALVLEMSVMHHLVERLVKRYTIETDSFNAVILFTIFFTVIGMSCLMTLIGDVVGHGFSIEQGIIGRFLVAWPRNFSLVLIIEIVLAQPVARKVMAVKHRKRESR